MSIQLHLMKQESSITQSLTSLDKTMLNVLLPACCGGNFLKNQHEVNQCILFWWLQGQELQNLSDPVMLLTSLLSTVHWYVPHCAVSLLNFLIDFKYLCKISRLFNTEPMSSILLVGNDLVLNVRSTNCLMASIWDTSPSHHATAVAVLGIVVPVAISSLQ